MVGRRQCIFLLFFFLFALLLGILHGRRRSKVPHCRFHRPTPCTASPFFFSFVVVEYDTTG